MELTQKIVHFFAFLYGSSRPGIGGGNTLWGARRGGTGGGFSYRGTLQGPRLYTQPRDRAVTRRKCCPTAPSVTRDEPCRLAPRSSGNLRSGHHSMGFRDRPAPSCFSGLWLRRAGCSPSCDPARAAPVGGSFPQGSWVREALKESQFTKQSSSFIDTEQNLKPHSRLNFAGWGALGKRDPLT